MVPGHAVHSTALVASYIGTLAGSAPGTSCGMSRHSPLSPSNFQPWYAHWMAPSGVSSPWSEGVHAPWVHT
jgi:hypothetical protein